MVVVGLKRRGGEGRVELTGLGGGRHAREQRVSHTPQDPESTNDMCYRGTLLTTVLVEEGVN